MTRRSFVLPGHAVQKASTPAHYSFKGFSVVSSTIEAGDQSCTFSPQIVLKHIRASVSSHQTSRLNVCCLRLEGPRSIQPRGIGEGAAHRPEETSPRLQPGQVRPADVAWWQRWQHSETSEDSGRCLVQI